MILGFKLFLHWFGMPSLRVQLPPIFTLTVDDIRERLRIEDEKVVDSIFQMVQSQVDRDAERKREIDSRASTLIALTSALGPIVTGAGLQLLLDLISRDGPVETLRFAGGVLTIATGLLVTVVVLGVFASLVSSKWRAVRDTEIFREEILRNVTDPANYRDQKSYMDRDYKRFMITHIWDLYRNNYLILESRGKRLRCAQLTLLGYVFALAIFGVVMLGYSLNAGRHKTKTACDSYTGTGLSYHQERTASEPDSASIGGSRTDERRVQ